MKGPMHRRCCQGGPWWVAGKGIHGKHPSANQAKTTDALEQRKPDRTTPWRQEPIPANSREDQEDTVDDEIDLLHPATRTKAQGANRLKPCIIARSRDPFKQIGCSKQERPDG